MQRQGATVDPLGMPKTTPPPEPPPSISGPAPRALGDVALDRLAAVLVLTPYLRGTGNPATLAAAIVLGEARDGPTSQKNRR